MTDDHSLYRKGVIKGLANKTDIDFIGEAEHGQDLLDQLKYLKPDMVILGINMPVLNGIDTLPILKERYPALKVIMLTMYDDARIISKAIKLGANAYLLKTSDCEIIYDAIVTCRKQWLYVNDVVRDALVRTAPKNSIKNELGLGEREMQVLQLLSDGNNSKMISDYIGLSERTVNAIVNLIMEKAGVQTLHALFEYAKEKHLI